ncbi:MAG: hypothetical protein LLG44_02415 [Chloroflexi bacterium]|nr:hypothetical protein [Chloroflexota bacterium]
MTQVDHPSGVQRQQRFILPIWLGALICILAGLVLYRQAFGFGFWYDDAGLNFQSATYNSFTQLTLPLANWDHYRPIGLLLMKLLYTLAGGFKGPVFHAVSIILNAANAGLLFLIAYRMTDSRFFAGAAAGIFIFFPFSVEVAAYFASVFHALLLFFSLLFLLTYLKAKRSSGWIYWALAHLMLLLAILSHESGIVLPFMVLALEILGHPLRQWRKRDWLRVLQFWVMPAIYMLVWWFLVPKTLGGNAPNTLFDNLLAVLQYLVYPFVPLIAPANPQTWMLITLTGTVLSLSFYLVRRTPWQRGWLWGLGWFLVSLAPSVVMLPSAYIQHSLYLGYCASLGISFFWAATICAIWQLAEHGWRKWLARAGAASVCALILFTALPFISRTMHDYALTTRIVQAMSAIARQTPSEQRLAFVNLPYYWVDESITEEPNANPYPWFRLANIVIPAYSSAGSIVWANDGPERAVDEYQYAGYEPGWATTGADISASGLRKLLETAQVYVLDLPRGEFVSLNQAVQAQEGEETDSRFASPLLNPPEFASEDELAYSSPIGWRIGEDIELVGYRCEPAAALPGEIVDVTLYWRQGANPASNPSVTLRLQDRFGGVLVERSFHPVSGMAPGDWASQQVYASRITFALPENASLGLGSLRISFRQDNLGLYTIQDSQGHTLVNEPVVTDFLVGRVSAIDPTILAPSYPTDAILGGQVQLLGYDLPAKLLNPGTSITVTLYWQPEQALADNYTVFVHLVGADGTPLAQHDSEPNNGQYPTSSWLAGQVIRDEHVLQLPADLPKGTYRLVIGMYSWPSLERLSAQVDGQPTGDVIRLEQALTVGP